RDELVTVPASLVKVRDPDTVLPVPRAIHLDERRAGIAHADHFAIPGPAVQPERRHLLSQRVAGDLNLHFRPATPPRLEKPNSIVFEILRAAAPPGWPSPVARAALRTRRRCRPPLSCPGGCTPRRSSNRRCKPGTLRGAPRRWHAARPATRR